MRSEAFEFLRLLLVVALCPILVVAAKGDRPSPSKARAAYPTVAHFNVVDGQDHFINGTAVHVVADEETGYEYFATELDDGSLAIGGQVLDKDGQPVKYGK